MAILFIGDSGDIQETLDSRLRPRLGAEFQICPIDDTPSAAIETAHLIIVGVETANQAGIVDRLLSEESVRNGVPLVVIVREPSGTQVLSWLRSGAAAVELWPCQFSRIEFLVDYLTVGQRLKPQRRVGLASGSSASPQADQIITTSPVMQRLMEQIERIAPLDVNVLFSGETGAGKTRLARLLHDCSRNRDASFVAVNCGALPENLLESELFGHRKGAFTGADANRKGRFEEVGRGTLFLDEVDSIPMSSQCKLLRAVENRVFEPLGCNDSIKFRGRILAASNASLEQLIEEGQFRADLFYRLGVVDLYIPPLRERPEDIRPIAEATLAEYSARNGLPIRSFSEQVISLLQQYAWPGNVRQLKNVVESSASLCRGEQIELTDLSGRWMTDLGQLAASKNEHSGRQTHVSRSLPINVTEVHEGISLAESRARLEADRIRNVLQTVGNNRTKAAIKLGISRTMLYKKLAKYGLAGTS